jgi:sentrin-specific protease 8
MAADPLVCTFHEATIYESDLKALAAPHWLNDSLITFYLQHLQHCAFSDHQSSSAGSSADDGMHGMLFLTPGAAFVLAHEDDADDFASTLDGLEIARHALVFLPINDNANVERGGGGSHWSLLVLDVRALAFAHFDSAGRANLAVARALAAKLHAALKPSSGSHNGALRLSSPLCPAQVDFHV